MKNYEQLLIEYIFKNGPIKTARVSSAQASGRAKQFSYWGVVRYNIIITEDGYLSNRPLERASSERRSRRLAEDDLDKLCEKEDRIQLDKIGKLRPFDLVYLTDCLKLGDENV